MEILLEILKITIPPAAVAITAWFIIKKFVDNEKEKVEAERKQAVHEHLLPIKLQAYERLILYLERISPNNMVMRVYKMGMSSRLLRAELLKAVREEFEHNFSQQLYVSHSAWQLTSNAKEEINKLVNIAAQNVGEEADGLSLSTAILEVATRSNKLPTEIAIEFLKKEMAEGL